ncbi:MAG TPA: thioesterase family protein, partial [Alteromonas macleodii]|nr:thioesterase family protein [Alteromonas macleodii]
MTVDELLNIPQLSQTSENTWKVDGLVIPKTWGQGRTAFGGISAGMLYTAVKQQVTDNR